ncbi:MAG: DUF1549 domain-containing protein [Pirellulaceae bacterium]|nr:DUF1549 domain-containing protein [Pirellulaceae bacterium]
MRLLVVTCLLLMSGPAVAADEVPLREVIDQHVRAGWQAQGIQPAGPASDAEFLRRVYLDLAGTIPAADDGQAFLDDQDPRKRQVLVDRLLADPRYALHQADVWDLALFGRDPPGYYARERQGFQRWLRDQFAANEPYDRIVRRMLMAEGDTAEHGAPMFLVQFDRHPEDAAVAVTRLFLGVQLECARCHDHPFEDYSQLDFYGLAAFYARLQLVEVGKLGNEKRLALGELNRGEILFSGQASEQTPGKKGEPVAARFMKGELLEEPELPADFKEEARFPGGKQPPPPRYSRKDRLAAWITAADNPYFARAAVNRVWAQFMGKGLVHPVDHLSPTNPASHPELLDRLSAEFVAHQFDLKWLIRETVGSQAYQLSSEGSASDAHPAWYERARFRPLSAEELLAAWRVATGYDASQPEAAAGGAPDERFKVQGVTWDYVRRFFGSPTDGVGNFQGGMHEHLYLNNGQVHSLITRRPGGLFDTLHKSSDPWPQRVERLFLQTLSRRPTAEESDTFAAYLSEPQNPTDRLHNAIWTLITCSEFRFNH